MKAELLLCLRDGLGAYGAVLGHLSGIRRLAWGACLREAARHSKRLDAALGSAAHESRLLLPLFTRFNYGARGATYSVTAASARLVSVAEGQFRQDPEADAEQAFDGVDFDVAFRKATRLGFLLMNPDTVAADLWARLGGGLLSRAEGEDLIQQIVQREQEECPESPRCPFTPSKRALLRSLLERRSNGQEASQIQSAVKRFEAMMGYFCSDDGEQARGAAAGPMMELSTTDVPWSDADLEFRLESRDSVGEFALVLNNMLLRGAPEDGWLVSEPDAAFVNVSYARTDYCDKQEYTFDTFEGGVVSGDEARNLLVDYGKAAATGAGPFSSPAPLGLFLAVLKYAPQADGGMFDEAALTAWIRYACQVKTHLEREYRAWKASYLVFVVRSQSTGSGGSRPGLEARWMQPMVGLARVQADGPHAAGMLQDADWMMERLRETVDAFVDKSLRESRESKEALAMSYLGSLNSLLGIAQTKGHQPKVLLPGCLQLELV